MQKQTACMQGAAADEKSPGKARSTRRAQRMVRIQAAKLQDVLADKLSCLHCGLQSSRLRLERGTVLLQLHVSCRSIKNYVSAVG